MQSKGNMLYGDTVDHDFRTGSVQRIASLTSRQSLEAARLAHRIDMVPQHADAGILA